MPKNRYKGGDERKGRLAIRRRETEDREKPKNECTELIIFEIYADWFSQLFLIIPVSRSCIGLSVCTLYVYFLKGLIVVWSLHHPEQQQ